MLQAAHLGSGSGSMIRKNDRRLVICLCPLLHDLHVASCDRLPTKRIGGIEYPTIDNSNAIWIKSVLDPEYYDPEYIQWNWKRIVPEPQPPHDHWLELLKTRGVPLT